jgi:DNA-directed RNA polymerase subunit RPC12/RpoP
MAEKITEYPPGRYDCDACGEAVMLTIASSELPECPRCGRRKYKDIPEPKVTEKKSAPPKKFKAGMYMCTACGEQMIIPEETDELPVCTHCNADQMKPA